MHHQAFSSPLYKALPFKSLYRHYLPALEKNIKIEEGILQRQTDMML